MSTSQAWTLEGTDKKKLPAFEMKCKRRILRTSWIDMMKSVSIKKKTAKEAIILDIIEEKKLRMFEHICN